MLVCINESFLLRNIVGVCIETQKAKEPKKDLHKLHKVDAKKTAIVANSCDTILRHNL